MQLAIAADVSSQEKITEILRDAREQGIDAYFLPSPKELADANAEAIVDDALSDWKFLGYYEALGDGGYSLLGAEAQRQYGRERLKRLCINAHDKNGSVILLGGKNARKIEFRATTSELHARIADFFDSVIPIFESRNIRLIIDALDAHDVIKHYCLTRVTDILRFLEYYRHPLFRVGIRMSQLLSINFTEEFLFERLMPYLSVVIFDDFTLPKDDNITCQLRIFRNLYREIILLTRNPQPQEQYRRGEVTEKFRLFMEM